jgi:mono/diheme cytochrome c family protein
VNSVHSKRRCWRLLLLAALAAGCDWPGRPNPADRPVAANKVVKFDVLYRENCAGCHGADGTFGPAPPLNNDLFRAIIPVKDLESVISKGRPGTPMPAFAEENGGTLTEVQIQVLVHEIKGVPYDVFDKVEDGVLRVEVMPDDLGKEPQWRVPPKAPATVPPYAADGAGSKEAGAKLFDRACSECHGANGDGIVADQPRKDKLNDPVFLALISDQALRRIVITGRSDLGMPSYAEPRRKMPDLKALTSQQVADLVAFMASWKQQK